MSNFYGELLIRITSDTAGLSKGLQSSAAQTAAASRSMEAAGKKAKVSWERVGLGMQNVGRTMTQFVTLPIAAGFAYAAYSGYKYSKTLLQIRNLTGLTAEETDKYGQSMLNMSKYGIGPQKLAEAMYFISSSGFKASEALKVLDVSAKASAAGMGDVEVMADVVTSALNSYGHGAYTAAQVTDILMKTVEVGKAEPQQLATSLGRILPIAKQLGVGFDELGGNVAALTLGGLSAAESVTSLRGTMVALTAPAKMSIDELKRLGLSYKEVTSSIKDKGLLPTLKMLWEATDHNMLSMRKIIPNVRATSGVMSLLGANYKKNLDVINQVEHAQGKLNETFAVTSQTPIQKFRSAIASIQASFIEMGIQIMPTIAGIVSKIGELFTAIGNMSEGWRSFVMWAGVVVAALGPVLMITGSVIRSVALIKGALVGLKSVQAATFALQAFAGGAASAGEAAALFAASLGPVGIALAAIAGSVALTVFLAHLSDRLDGTTERIKAMKIAVDNIESDTTGTLKDKLDRMFGGHLESEAGKIVWKPQIDFKPPSKVNGLVEWVKKEAAEATAAIREKNKAILIEEAKGNAAYFTQQAKEMVDRAKASGARGAVSSVLSSDRYKDLIAKAKEYGLSVSQLTGQLGRLQEADSKLVLFAGQQDRIKAVHDQVKKVADLNAKLAKDPTNIKLGLKADKAERDLANLKKELADYQKQNYEALLEVRIDNAKARLSEINKALARLNKIENPGPTVSAQIKAFMAERAKVVANLTKLNGMTASPTVTANVSSALSAIGSVQAALSGIRDKWVSVHVNKSIGGGVPVGAFAAGGIDFAKKATPAVYGEAGPEIAAYFPLNDPARSASLLAQLNSILGGGKVSGGGGGGGPAAGVGSTQLVANLYVDGQFMEVIAAEIVGDSQLGDYQSARAQKAGY